jgi:hypothetical protein
VLASKTKLDWYVYSTCTCVLRTGLHLQFMMHCARHPCLDQKQWATSLNNYVQRCVHPRKIAASRLTSWFYNCLSFDNSQQRSHLHLLRKRSVVLIVIQELFRYTFRQVARKKISWNHLCEFENLLLRILRARKFVKTQQVTLFLKGEVSKTTDVRFNNNIWEKPGKTLPSGNFSFSYFEVCHAGSSLFSDSEVSHSLELNRKKVLIIGNFPNLSLFSFDKLIWLVSVL